MKKSLLLWMLCFVCLGNVSAELVEIGTAEGLTTTSSYLPAYTLYNNTLSEQLYSPDEIGTAGTISSIAFFNGGSEKSPSVKIYLVNTDKEAFASTTDWLDVSDADLVFDGLVTFTPDEWTTIEFVTPFEYDGSSYLGVIVDVNLNWSSGLSCRVFPGADNCAMYAYNDNTDFNAVGAAYTANARAAVKNQLQLEIEASSGGPTCDKPSALDVAEITVHEASLGWADGSGTYNLEIKKQSESDWTSLLSATSDFSYDLTDLDPFTTYQVRVQSICDDTVSGWKSVSFTTLAGVPFIENFNGTSMPSGWSQASGLLDNIMSGSATLSSGTGWNFGSHNVLDSHAYANIYGTSSYKWLITPEIFIEENSQLSFDLALTHYNNSAAVVPGEQADDKFIVLASLDGGETWEILRQWDNQSSEDVYDEITNSAAGQSVVISLESFAEQSVTLAFYGESTVSGGDNDIHVDNVRVDYVPLCEKPVNLSVVEESATENSVDLEWEDEMASTWLLQYKKSSDEEWTSLAELVTENPFTLEGLDASSTYRVRIAAWCDPSDSASISDFTNPISFTTECGVISVDAEHPYSEGFEDCIANTSYTPSANYLPLCWSYINECTYSSYKWYPVVDSYSSSYPHSGDNYLKFYSYYSSYTDYDPQPQYAILPEMSDLDSKQLILYARGYNANTSIFIGRMSDPADTSTFSLIAEQVLTTTHTQYEFNLAGVEGDHIAIMIEAASASKTTIGAYIDDIIVREAPSCLKPTALVVDSITTSSAKLSWTPGGSETEWNLYYKKSSDSTFVMVPVAQNPYLLTGLEGSSKYQFFVVAKCSEEDLSEPSAISGFATDCDAISILPWSEDFDSYSGSTSASAPAGYSDDDLPTCWAFLNRNQSPDSYPQVFISSNSGYPVAGNCLFFKSSSSTPLYAILPEFGTDIAGLQLSFTYRNEGTSGSNGTLHVGYMADPADASTYTEVAAYPQTTTLTRQEITFVGAPAGSRIAFKYQGGSSNNYYLSIDNVVVAPLPSCVKPRAITVTDVTSHTATLAWTAGAEETAWQIILNGDEEHLIEADANPFALTALPADSVFVAKVRANCGDDYSEWSNDSVRFTTLVACPAPVFSSDSVKNITAHSADISWGGDAESYNVSYRIPAHVNAIFAEDFENGIGDWTMEDCHSSTGVISGAFRFYYTDYPPQYLISPELTGITEGMVLQFYYGAESLTYPESFQVGFSSTDNQSTSFTFGDEETTSNAGVWNLYSVAIPADAKYFAIKCTSDDMFYLYIDDVAVGMEVPAGEWVNESNIAANSFSLVNLEDESLYEVKIQANCGPEGTSVETASVFFQTLSDCETPSNLQLVSVGLDTATISWNTYGLSEFNVRYSADGEVWTVVEASASPFTISNLEPGTQYLVQVRPGCDTLKWSAVLSIKTQYTIPYAPEFSTGIVSSEWKAYKMLAAEVFAGETMSVAGTWNVVDANESFEETHLKKNVYGTGCKDWIVSPAINLTGVQLAADEKLKLSFRVALAKYSSSASTATPADTTGVDDKFIVAFSIDGGQTWSQENATIWSNEPGAANIYNYIPREGLDVSIDVSAAAGHVMKFAFYGESTLQNADNDLHIGNILLDIVGNTTGIDALENSTDAVKFFKDGHFYILRDGVIYDMIGRKVK